MGRSTRCFAWLLLTSVLAIGLQVVATAPPALASFCGDGDCGEASIQAQLFPRPAGYGERITAQGIVHDASASCSQIDICDWPLGEVEWYIDGVFYQKDYLEVVVTQNEDGTFSGHESSWYGPMYIDSLDAGSYVMRFDYVPENFDADSLTFEPLEIYPAWSDVVLTQSSTTSGAGEPIVLTANITGVYNGDPLHPHHFAKKPQGTVSLFDGGTLININNVVDGVTTFTLPFEGFGERSFTARYDGDNNYEGSVSAPVRHTFTKAAVTNTLQIAPAANTLPGELVTLTSTIAPASASNVLTPTGAVTFTDTTTGSTLGTAALNASGVATLTRGFNAGTHQIEAAYSGDDSFLGRTTMAGHDVDKGSVTVGIGQSPLATVWGQPFDIASPVRPIAPALGPVTGTVTIRDGKNELGTRPLTIRGEDLLTVSDLEVGSHTLTAHYSGSANFNPGVSGALTHVVNKGDVDVVADQSKATTVFGEEFTLRALVGAVAPAAGPRTGTVTFTDTSTGDVLGTRPLDAAGQASLPVTLALGDHDISVAYSGDGHFNGGTGAVSHSVEKASSAVVVSSATAEPSALGDAVTLRTTVAAVAPGAGLPTGVVQFRDGSRLIGAPVALVNGGAEIVVPAFSGGLHSVQVDYAGDDNFLGATSASLLRRVRCDRTIIGPLANATFEPGLTTCFQGATVSGNVVIPAGARVSIVDSNFGRITSNQPGALVMCGSRVTTAITVTRAAGTVSIGDPFASACAPNQIGDASFMSNTRGVRVQGSSFSKNLSVTNTSGGATIIGGNAVAGTLSCANNNPAATNGGNPNTAGQRKGDCATLDGTISPDPH